MVCKVDRLNKLHKVINQLDIDEERAEKTWHPKEPIGEIGSVNPH